MPFFQTFSCVPTVFPEFLSCYFPFFFSSSLIVFQHFPLFSSICNPSPLLPRHHSSSPCEPSCSEPQRTLLSIELRIFSFFNMLASMFLAFSSFALPPFHAFFSNPFLRSYDFSRVSFLLCPHFPNGFLDFLGFSKLAIHFLLQFNGFFHNFPPLSPCF